MKLLVLTLSVFGLAAMSYLFWGTFSTMQSSNDAVYAILQGIGIAIMGFFIALNIKCIYLPLRKIFRMNTIR